MCCAEAARLPRQRDRLVEEDLVEPMRNQALAEVEERGFVGLELC
jgi:hypothetical protein